LKTHEQQQQQEKETLPPQEGREKEEEEEAAKAVEEEQHSKPLVKKSRNSCTGGCEWQLKTDVCLWVGSIAWTSRETSSCRTHWS
jgi:hypothetical protein